MNPLSQGQRSKPWPNQERHQLQTFYVASCKKPDQTRRYINSKLFMWQVWTWSFKIRKIPSPPVPQGIGGGRWGEWDILFSPIAECWLLRYMTFLHLSDGNVHFSMDLQENCLSWWSNVMKKINVWNYKRNMNRGCLWNPVIWNKRISWRNFLDNCL